MELSDYVVAYFVVQAIFTAMSFIMAPLLIDDPPVGRFYKRWYISFAITTAGVLAFQPYQDTVLALGIVFTVLLIAFPSLDRIIEIKNKWSASNPKQVEHGYRISEVHGQYVAMMPENHELMGMGDTEEEAVRDLDRQRVELQMVKSPYS